MCAKYIEVFFFRLSR